MSVADLCEKVGMAQETLSRYENKHVVPSLPRLIDIAEALGVPLEVLATGKSCVAEQPAPAPVDSGSDAA